MIRTPPKGPVISNSPSGTVAEVLERSDLSGSAQRCAGAVCSLNPLPMAFSEKGTETYTREHLFLRH